MNKPIKYTDNVTVPSEEAVRAVEGTVGYSKARSLLQCGFSIEHAAKHSGVPAAEVAILYDVMERADEIPPSTFKSIGRAARDLTDKLDGGDDGSAA